MKTVFNIRSAAAALLTAAAFSVPTLAQASEPYSRYYDASAECKSKENDAQLIGGLLGAVVGGVVGSQVSGNGARTEGSAIGAIVGGLAGAGIGDESVDCNKRYERNTYYGGSNHGTQAGYVRTSNNTRQYGQYYSQPAYQPSGYRTNTSSHRDYRKHDRKLASITSQLRDVSQRLHSLREDERRIRRKARHTNRSHTYRRLESICHEIERLERKSRLLKKRRRQLIAIRY